jgi:hypothetical protein
MPTLRPFSSVKGDRRMEGRCLTLANKLRRGLTYGKSILLNNPRSLSV